MLGGAINRRRALAIAAMVLLAGCKVIPKVEPGPAPAPKPTEGALPTDTDRHRVALLVPLSGANADVGQSIANAATMALLDTNAENLRITTYDTATGADSAAARALADGNKLILGPLLSEDVMPILSRARPAGVPLIAFSNDTSVATNDVFVMGVSPEQSIVRSIDFAKTLGTRKVALLVPDGEYGARAESAFRYALSQSGLTLAGRETYDRGNTSIVSAAKRLRAKGGFDTILIAEGPRLSIQAAGAIRPANATSPMLLGTELWSGDASVASSAALRGALFSTISDGRFGQFAESYRERFGSTPHRIATLGYDSVLLTLRVARDWKPGKAFPLAKMRDGGGFLGLDGPFRFRADGVVERAMEVRQVGKGKIDVVSLAPDRFED
ncbi:penicillin-binding protein activator [Altererythrobacter fulvus]|uniref:penicillin-binding protein activator n=1 Tax=Caenibius fulvus TaxID=2126012 RepID=UPI0030159F54